jgi:CBS domain containing-hemolysin-like protein
MYRYIGLLQPACGRDAPEETDGFMVNGTSSLQSLAHFYGLKPPASEPGTTVADYLRNRCGRPRVGDRAAWERVELVVQEMEDQTIRKVRLTLLPLQDRRGRQPAATLSARRGARERRSRASP